MAASYVVWLLLPSYGWLVVFAAVLGIAYGVRIALVAPVLIELFGASRLGGLLGTFFTATGIAGLAAPTAANLAVDYWGSDIAGIAVAIALGALAYALVLPLKASPERLEQRAAGKGLSLSRWLTPLCLLKGQDLTSFGCTLATPQLSSSAPTGATIP